MAEGFDLFAIEHTQENWPRVREELTKVLKPGQRIGFEINPRAYKEILPYLDVIKKQLQHQPLTDAEHAQLKHFVEASKKHPSIGFSARLMYYLREKGCELVPIGSNRASSVHRKLSNQLWALEREAANKLLASGKVSPKATPKQIELSEKVERAVMIKEGAFLRAVKRERPAIVIVGALHRKVFAGLPHRVVMDDLPRVSSREESQLLAIKIKQRATARRSREVDKIARSLGMKKPSAPKRRR